jgi:tRNA (guanine37-N1)-methyltransferase
MKISILTLFPEMFTGPFDFSIMKRAKTKNLVGIELINIRNYTKDAYKTVDDHPYGGGVGMVMRVDILDAAISDCLSKNNIKRAETRIILTDPKGTIYTQKKARVFAEKYKHLIIICGHYEGVDERITNFIDERISVGKYILSGGEMPAIIITESIIRLLPGVLKSPQATIDESYTYKNILEYPQYTRPPEYHGYRVPDILLSGNHNKISAWKLDFQQKKKRKTTV